MATETPGERLDRKNREAGEARDKATAKARKDELASQQAVVDAVTAVTRDKDGDPIAIEVPAGVTGVIKP